MRRRPESTPQVPRSVALAIRSAWALVGVLGLVAVLMAVFYDQVVGSWAARHDGARQAFAQGGRLGLERAGFAPPSFLPVTVTMVVVAAMIVWVLAAFLRLGYRWGQLGLVGVTLACVYLSVALGLVLAPPPVFSVAAVASLLVEGVGLVCLWHRDTRAYVRGPWVGGPGYEPDPTTAAGPSGASGSSESSGHSGHSGHSGTQDPAAGGPGASDPGSEPRSA